MHEKRDNFTADSLERFIKTPPSRSILDEEMNPDPGQKSQIPQGKPRTARAARVGQILESMTSSSRAEPVMNDPGAASPRHHDAQIRQHMGELVRMMLQEGRTEDLEVILQNHQHFIAEVLELIRQGRR